MDPLPIVVAFDVSEQVATGLFACGLSLLLDEFDPEGMKEALPRCVDAPIFVKSFLVSGWSFVAACTGSRRPHGLRSVLDSE